MAAWPEAAFTFGIGFADHTRFNASLKGIIGASASFFGAGAFAMSEGFRKLLRESPTQYAALGFYICHCSAVEASLHLFLRRLLGIDEPIERLLVGEPRIGDLIELVKKSARLKSMDARRLEILERLLGIVSENNKIRQVIAHKPGGTAIDDGELIFHNAPSAKSLDSQYVYRCTAEQLENQAILLVEISLRLALLSNLPDEKMLRFEKSTAAQLALLESSPRPTIPSPLLPPKLPKRRRRPHASGR